MKTRLFHWVQWISCKFEFSRGSFKTVLSLLMCINYYRMDRTFCGTKLSQIAPFHKFCEKSFANPIAVRYVICQFQLHRWVFTNETSRIPVSLQNS